jgi:hypothetical protein
MNFDMNVVNKYMSVPRKVHLEALIKNVSRFSKEYNIMEFCMRSGIQTP